MEADIIKADNYLFKEYWNQLLEIYEEAATNGILEQYLDMEKEAKYLKEVFNSWEGFFAVEGENLIGFILSMPLSYDKLLPESLRKRYPLKRCFYIEELHINKNHRRKGIGSNLIKITLKNIDRKRYDYLFIRAAIKNIPAINLYKKLGFIPDEKIKQKKIKKDRSGTFMLTKQYLVQRLNYFQQFL
ncbi:GNAT family N-acetyltransferase [Candidatus Woesearchaeota archaeon]|nr:GNAT family N-acetyltransferase [Candidatus Woesearchaeota archaeon]